MVPFTFAAFLLLASLALLAAPVEPWLKVVLWLVFVFFLGLLIRAPYAGGGARTASKRIPGGVAVVTRISVSRSRTKSGRRTRIATVI
jgi:hypothetical protein